MDGTADAANVLLGSNQSAATSRHCALAVNILNASQSNLLKKLQPAQARLAWDFILRLIIGTDMAAHWVLLANTRMMESVNWKDYAQKILALTMLLKCATIGFVTKEEDACETHLLALRQELGLEPAVSHEEELFGPPSKWPPDVSRMKGNLAFATIIAHPTLLATSKLIDGMKPLIEMCEEHMARWKLTLYPPPEESTSIVISMD
jgi:hypothetical protein